MKAKKAFITGIAGQDGSYLAELLVSLGYQVEGTIRKRTNTDNLKNLTNKVKLHEIDLTNFSKLKSAILKITPDQIYNLGGVTTLSAFEKDPLYARKVTENAAKVIFDTAVQLKESGYDIKIFQASSCLVFGLPNSSPQNENTPFNPLSSYAESKLGVDLFAKKMRDKEKISISCGILYNHESPRRPLDFVTRKITAAAACIYNKVKKIPCDKSGKPILTEKLMLPLGDIQVKKDWGDARDFVRAFLLMLEQEIAEDYVIATGKIHSVQDVLEIAFGLLNLDWRKYVVEAEVNIRFHDSSKLCGDATKAYLKLGWLPQIKLEDTIKDMVENDLYLFSR